MSRWFWRWGPAVVQMALIFIASSIPNLQAMPGDVSDKTMHFLAYAILGVCVFRALASARWAGLKGRHALRALAVSSLYGVSDEIHQRFVPGRSPDVHDWVADTLGAGAAILLVLLFARLSRLGRPGAGESGPDQSDLSETNSGKAGKTRDV